MRVKMVQRNTSKWWNRVKLLWCKTRPWYFNSPKCQNGGYCYNYTASSPTLVTLPLPCKIMFLFLLIIIWNLFASVSISATFAELCCDWLTNSRPVCFSQSEQTHSFLHQSEAESKPAVTLFWHVGFTWFGFPALSDGLAIHRQVKQTI